MVMIAPLLVTVLVMAGGLGAAGAVPQSLAQMALLGGTIVSIDEAGISITLRMPEGHVRSFAAKDRRLLQGLALGDHISFELGDNDTIITLTKLPTDPAN